MPPQSRSRLESRLLSMIYEARGMYPGCAVAIDAIAERAKHLFTLASENSAQLDDASLAKLAGKPVNVFGPMSGKEARTMALERIRDEDLTADQQQRIAAAALNAPASSDLAQQGTFVPHVYLDGKRLPDEYGDWRAMPRQPTWQMKEAGGEAYLRSRELEGEKTGLTAMDMAEGVYMAMFKTKEVGTPPVAPNSAKGARVCGAFVMTGAACPDCPTLENCRVLRDRYIGGSSEGRDA